MNTFSSIYTVYPKKYAHGFCFAVLCCGYTLTDFIISIRLTSLALWQSNDCPSASKATLMIMDKYFMWIHYERLHNHNKAKHNKTVCIFLGIYCIYKYVYVRHMPMLPVSFGMTTVGLGVVVWFPNADEVTWFQLMNIRTFCIFMYMLMYNVRRHGISYRSCATQLATRWTCAAPMEIGVWQTDTCNELVCSTHSSIELVLICRRYWQ